MAGPVAGPGQIDQSGPMKRKLDLSDLATGMYVCELDRPWLESQCLFQGFFIQSDQHLRELRSGCLSDCRYIVIDTLKGADLPPQKHIRLLQQQADPKGERRYPRSVSVEEEFDRAHHARVSARDLIDRVFADVASGDVPHLPELRKVVSDLVESVIRNPDAQMCLSQLKNRDEYTAQHSVNVCVLSIAFGRHLGLSRPALNLLGTGALLHDIGKLKTPLDILNKPGRLTDEEFRIMKEHPAHGRELLRQIPGLPPEAIDVAYNHHERLQGHGYPRGLKSGEISQWSKMVAIVDVYDAITSDRCYHDGMAPTDALTRMYEWRHRDFDPELLEQFIQCIGIYPIGSLVELSTGEVGVVISVNPRYRLRPKVSVVLDGDKNPCFPVRIVDLAQFVEQQPEACTIAGVLDQNAYNVDVQAQLREIKAGRSQ